MGSDTPASFEHSIGSGYADTLVGGPGPHADDGGGSDTMA